MAHVISSRQVDLDEVIERMIDRGSTVTKADILSVMEDFQSTVENLLSEGLLYIFVEVTCVNDRSRMCE